MVHRLISLTALGSLLVGFALLVSLHHEVRQTRQLLSTLVVQGSQAAHLGMQAHMNALAAITQLFEQTALLRNGTVAVRPYVLRPSTPDLSPLPEPVKE